MKRLAVLYAFCACLCIGIFFLVQHLQSSDDFENSSQDTEAVECNVEISRLSVARHLAYTFHKYAVIWNIDGKYLDDTLYQEICILEYSTDIDEEVKVLRYRIAIERFLVGLGDQLRFAIARYRDDIVLENFNSIQWELLYFSKPSFREYTIGSMRRYFNEQGFFSTQTAYDFESIVIDPEEAFAHFVAPVISMETMQYELSHTYWQFEWLYDITERLVANIEYEENTRLMLDYLYASSIMEELAVSAKKRGEELSQIRNNSGGR